MSHAVFVDTFTNHLEPEIGLAALRCLEAAGFEAGLAPNVCCGRTLISAGHLDEARLLAVRNLELLRPLALEGVTIVGLEPSCLLTFHDEFARLLPDSPDVRAVAAASRLVDDVLAETPPRGLRPTTERFVVHPHCHQRALADPGAPARALAAIPGAAVETLDAGCCGMAGSFGYAHPVLSAKIAADRLLPALLERPDAVIVAAGTSCRTQMHDLANRRTRHLVEVLADHLDG